MPKPTSTTELEQKLEFINSCYARLEASRAAWEEKLKPQLGDPNLIQPNVVEAINRLSLQMEELVRRSDEVLMELGQ